MMVGPYETASMPGTFSPMMPHSRPAWMAATLGSFPSSSLKAALVTCRRATQRSAPALSGLELLVKASELPKVNFHFLVQLWRNGLSQDAQDRRLRGDKACSEHAFLNHALETFDVILVVEGKYGRMHHADHRGGFYTAAVPSKQDRARGVHHPQSFKHATVRGSTLLRSAVLLTARADRFDYLSDSQPVCIRGTGCTALARTDNNR